jgi:SAM-dependent methyltransferase
MSDPATIDLAVPADNSRGVLADEAFERLVAAEDGSFWFRARNALLLQTLRRQFPDAGSFLEVGCGNGYVLAAVAADRPGMLVTGSDLSQAGLANAARRAPGAALLQADARDLPFEDAFDVAGAFDVIEHVPQDDAVLAALRRAVKPGGGVIVTVPQHPWLWSETDRYSGHQRRYRRRELEGKFAQAGLRLRMTTSFVTLLLPLMAASRAWQAVSPRPYDPGRELQAGERLDALLERIMALEVRAIGRGVRLPIGGSLLAVAERPAR